MAIANWERISTIVIMIGGLLGILTYFNGNFTSTDNFDNLEAVVIVNSSKVEKISTLEFQQASIVEQLKKFQIDSKKDRLEAQIENTEDKIFDREREMARDPNQVTDKDRRALERLETRLQRYEERLETLEDNSI
jgi:valyl-tRNA synthetase